MKLYLDYKNLSKIKLGISILILFIIPFAFSRANLASDLNSKINQKNQDIDKLEAEIKQYQSELNDLAKQKSSLNGSLQALDLNKKKLTADISVTQNKIDKALCFL